MSTPSAHAWRDHLVAGGTTPWLEFAESDAPADGWLPGAQQLELLRRVNEVRPAGERLARVILAAPLPFRGRPDLDLLGADPTPGHGPEPVDPATLPDDELVRVAVALLAPAAAGRAEPEASDPPITAKAQRRLRHLTSRPYRLVGDLVLAARVREVLVEHGREPADGGDVIVVADAVDRMLADAWWHQVVTVGAPPWHVWLRNVAARDRLPRLVDVPAVAARWSARRPGRVHVALGAAEVSRAAGGPGEVVVRRVAAAEAELSRRVGMLLGVLVEPERRTSLLRRGVLPVGSEETSPLPLDPRTHAWASTAAERMTHRLQADGYPVEADALAPSGQPERGVRRLTSRGVLPLAIRALLALSEDDLFHVEGEWR